MTPAPPAPPRPRERRARRPLRDALGVAAVTALLLLLLEGGLRLFWPHADRLETSDGAPFAVRDAALGYRLHPAITVVHRAPEFTARYRTDALGLRDGPWRAAGGDSAARPRVLLVGDSFTFGHGLDDGATWAALLAAGLRAGGASVDVVNAGVPGYSTANEAAWLERLLPRLRPDAVVLAFLPNDLAGNEAGIAAEDGAAGEGGGLGGLHVVRAARRLAFTSDALYVRLYLATGRRSLASAPGLAGAGATQAAFGRVARACQRTGAQLAVVSIPQRFGVLYEQSGAREPGVDVRAADRFLATLVTGTGAAWWPAFDTLRAASRTGERYFPLDGHLNPDGARVLAAFLVPRVRGLLAAPAAPPPARPVPTRL